MTANHTDLVITRRYNDSVWIRVVVVVLLAQSGCFAIAIGTTHHEIVTETIGGTRLTSQPADVAGTQCYVDQQHVLYRRKRVSSYIRFGALLELTGGLVASLFGAPYYYGGLPAMADGLIAAAWAKGQDGKDYVERQWEVSMETQACAH
jgi:hypothetical protein